MPWYVQHCKYFHNESALWCQAPCKEPAAPELWRPPWQTQLISDVLCGHGRQIFFFFFFFNVSLSPQRPYGLLGRRNSGRPPRLSHSVPELWTTKPDTTHFYTNMWPFRRQERCLGGELCFGQSPDDTSMSFHLTVVLATWRTMCHHLYVFTLFLLPGGVVLWTPAPPPHLSIFRTCLLQVYTIPVAPTPPSFIIHEAK